MSERSCGYCHACKVAEIVHKKFGIPKNEVCQETNDFDPIFCPRTTTAPIHWIELNAPPTTPREISLAAGKTLGLSILIEDF